MELKEIKDLLGKVVYTLDTIEIRGKQNMDRMLGCIQLLEHIANNLPETCSEEKPVVECSTLDQGVETKSQEDHS